MVKVAEDQQSLAIGKGGQNVRLAAKLTGWKIDIQSAKSSAIAEGSSDTAETEEQTKKKRKSKKETTDETTEATPAETEKPKSEEA